MKDSPVIRKPISCIVDPRRGLMYVKWQDEHESLIPLQTVRQHCPCVECRMLRENSDPLRTLKVGQAEPSIEPVGVEQLGNHALQITWKDGHNAGLYPWPLLRGLCPCDACEQARRTKP